MVFSSPIFLFVFFPLFFLVYYLIPNKGKTLWLLLASLLFYAWGEPVYLLLMLAEIGAIWLLALGIGRLQEKKRRGAATALFLLGLFLILGCLLYFKYATFAMTEVKKLFHLRKWRIAKIALPIGISFYTFQALSYLVDVYRGKQQPQRSAIQLGAYITMFPQLIAGPIVRYEQVEGTLRLLQTTKGTRRIVSRENIWHGLQRFLVGLGKKVILANTLAAWADPIWATKPQHLSCGVVWFAVVAFTLQLYYDFSGYSDMAIGLGEMMGFRLPENFNYPYISRSAREFWRRWHMTLSSWFRDYVYIPLGGNRKGTVRTMGNLLIVFALCGLWHGAAWNYFLWGLYWGLFLMLERIPALQRAQKRLPALLRWMLTMLLVFVSMIFFQEKELPVLLGYLSVLFGGASTPTYPLIALLSAKKVLVLVIGCMGVLPVVPWLRKRLTAFPKLNVVITQLVTPLLLLGVLVICVMLLAANTYNPFIYFRF